MFRRFLRLPRRTILSQPFPMQSATFASHTSLPHVARTRQEPRHNALHLVKIRNVCEVNPMIRMVELSTTKDDEVEFLPGQWLDVYIPHLKNAGGFTITSTPREARLENSGVIKLAIQKSPQNPAAVWLWQPEEKVLNQTLAVRVGGSFVWPPPSVSLRHIHRLVLIAGGVGINPLFSIFSSLHDARDQDEPQEPRPPVLESVHFLYTTHPITPNPDEILFLKELRELLKRDLGSGQVTKRILDLYLTNPPTFSKPPFDQSDEERGMRVRGQRISHEDLLNALGPVEGRRNTIVYVCGPRGMTDEFVELLQKAEGMSKERVLCEKWW